MRLSIIIAVLDSHEVLRRQLLHFSKMRLSEKGVEIIIVDDGSYPPLRDISGTATILYTNDKRPWTQPCARNYGAQLAEGEYFFMTDIDHILTFDSIKMALDFDVDKMMFPRRWSILDLNGNVCNQPDKLFEYGLNKELYDARGLSAGMHTNTFVMRAQIFNELGGYDESFCGKYGGDDTDFAYRYSKLHYDGKVSRHVMGPPIGVYPDPQSDVKKIFHRLREK